MGDPHRAPARRLAVDAVPVRRVGDPLSVQHHHLDAADQLLRLVHQLSLRTAQRLSSEHSARQEKVDPALTLAQPANLSESLIRLVGSSSPHGGGLLRLAVRSSGSDKARASASSVGL